MLDLSHPPFMAQNSFLLPINTDLDLKVIRATLLTRPPSSSKNEGEQDGKDDHILSFSISIRNAGNEAIRLTGKKWVIEHANKTFDVFESSTVFNSRPILLPGQIFAFNGYHVVIPPAALHLTLLGKNDSSLPFRTKTLVIHPPSKRKR